MMIKRDVANAHPFFIIAFLLLPAGTIPGDDIYHVANKIFYGTLLKVHFIMSKESFSINGEHLLNKVKELIEEGNIRKITIADKTGKEIMSFPLTVGVVGVLLAPVFAAVGALAAMIGECTITVERENKNVNDEP